MKYKNELLCRDCVKELLLLWWCSSEPWQPSARINVIRELAHKKSTGLDLETNEAEINMFILREDEDVQRFIVDSNDISVSTLLPFLQWQLWDNLAFVTSIKFKYSIYLFMTWHDMSFNYIYFSGTWEGFFFFPHLFKKCSVLFYNSYIWLLITILANNIAANWSLCK